MAAEDTRRFKSTEELAFANIGGEMPQSLPTDRYGTVEGEQRKLLQRQIDAAMIGAIQDTRRPNPITGNGSLPSVTVGGAAPARSGEYLGRGSGWREAKPIGPVATPMAQAVMDGLAHQHLPMGQGNSEFKGKKSKEP
jgi:hypothetical protein